MVWTKEWLVSRIKYYRKLDFFKLYHHLSDDEIANKIMELDERDCRYQYTQHYVEKGSDDWQFLTLDRNRVLWVDTGWLYGSLPPDYSFTIFVQTLQSLACISRNVFLPQNIIDIEGKSIEFTLNNQKYNIVPKGACDDKIILAEQINPIIKSTGYQFEFWNFLPDIYIVFFTEEEKTQLIQDGNWW